MNVVAPLGATPDGHRALGQAHFNVVMYPETAETAARWMERTFGQPYTKTVPIGVGATRDFIAEVAEITGRRAVALMTTKPPAPALVSRSVDSDLSDRQARLHLWRCDPCHRRRAHRPR